MKQARWIVAVLVIITAVAVVHSQTTIIQRPRSSTGLSSGVGYGTEFPTSNNSDSGPIDGELFIRIDAGTDDPRPYVYSDASGDWFDVQLSKQNVLREDFTFTMFKALENDETAAVTTDAGVNYLTLYGPGDIDIIGYRLEAPDGPGLAATPNPGAVAGVFTTAGYVDNADNEGINFTFGAHDNATGLDNGIHYSETNSGDTYCEIRVDIADVSDTDDLWFGWELNDATDNPPASADFDTYAGFTLADDAGDIQICTALNNAAEGCDDAGTDWSDGDQFVLRVTMSADSVSFAADLTDGGTTVSSLTQTNATLNADDGDVFKCVLGWTNGAAGDPTVVVDYVEIGLAEP